MGTSGVKWHYDKTALITSLKARKGKIILVAKDFKVDRHTVSKVIREDEELAQLVADIRNDYDETSLDAAEDTLLYALSIKKDDLSSALRSAFFLLNNKGKGRGYAHPKSKEDNDNDEKVSVRELRGFIMECNSESKRPDNRNEAEVELGAGQRSCQTNSKKEEDLAQECGDP